MKKWRAGFTIIEITLFLAITGLLFMGIMVGTQNSINQQRAYDSVQSFAEFLRSVYSGVTNPQSQLVGGGKSDKALYGKMITFGEENDKNQIFVYDVIGKVDPVIDLMANNDICKNTVYKDFCYLNLNIKNEQNSLIGIPESYAPKWQSKIETTDKNSDKLFAGTILILRHPRSGTINTLFSTTVINVFDEDYRTIDETIKNMFGSFSQGQIDFCIDSFNDPKKRTDVRVVEGAHNSSGIQIIDLDSEENICNK